MVRQLELELHDGYGPYVPLPNEARSVTHKLSIDGRDSYVTAGMYDDGRLGEIHVVMGNRWALPTAQAMERVALVASDALQHGVSTQQLHLVFDREQLGWSSLPEAGHLQELTEAILAWLGHRFPDGYYQSSGVERQTASS